MEHDNWREIAARGMTYAGEQAFRLTLTAITGILVARHLGPEGLGLLGYAQAVFSLLIPVVLLGMPAVLVRRFSTEPDWRTTLASALAAQLPVALIVGVTGFIIVASPRGFAGQPVLTALVLVPLPALALQQTVRSYLEATGRSRTILFAGIAAGLTASAIKIAAILLGADVWVFALAGTVEVGVLAAVLAKGLPESAGDRPLIGSAQVSVIRNIARESWPLFFASLAVIIYMRVDVVMLGLLSGDEETGVYTAAARLSEVWYFLPVAAVAALRPHLSRLHVQGAEQEYELMLQRFMTVAAATAFVAVAAVLLVGKPVVMLLYGPEFEASASVLQVHILAAPFVFLMVAAGPWFVDRLQTRSMLVRHSTGAVVNVALNLWLVPKMGAMGAAVATFASYALSGVIMNGVLPSGRVVFALQCRALALRWKPPARFSQGNEAL